MALSFISMRKECHLKLKSAVAATPLTYKNVSKHCSVLNIKLCKRVLQLLRMLSDTILDCCDGDECLPAVITVIRYMTTSETRRLRVDHIEPI